MGEVLLGLDESLVTLSLYFFAISLLSLSALGDGQLLNMVESSLNGLLLCICLASIIGV